MSQTIKLDGSETGSLRNAIDLMEKAREEAQSIGIKGLAADIKRLIFDPFPDVYAVGFYGYTPSWNDRRTLFV